MRSQTCRCSLCVAFGLSNYLSTTHTLVVAATKAMSSAATQSCATRQNVGPVLGPQAGNNASDTYWVATRWDGGVVCRDLCADCASISLHCCVMIICLTLYTSGLITEYGPERRSRLQTIHGTGQMLSQLPSTPPP